MDLELNRAGETDKHVNNATNEWNWVEPSLVTCTSQARGEGKAREGSLRGKAWWQTVGSEAQQEESEQARLWDGCHLRSVSQASSLLRLAS